MDKRNVCAKHHYNAELDKNIISIQNIYYSYKKGRNVIQDLSVQIGKGEVYGLLGHNGAGKTTLMRLILNLVSPNSGVIKINNDNSNKSISYMPESVGVYEKLNAYQNLEIRGTLLNMDKDQIRERANKLSKDLGLDFKGKELVGYWSNGLKRRLSLCCSLINKPDILLLDEPFNSIDPISLKIIVASLEELNKAGTTIVISSHDLVTISKICSKITIIQEGKPIYTESVNKISSLEEIYQSITTSGNN